MPAGGLTPSALHRMLTEVTAINPPITTGKPRMTNLTKPIAALLCLALSGCAHQSQTPTHSEKGIPMTPEMAQRVKNDPFDNAGVKPMYSIQHRFPVSDETLEGIYKEMEACYTAQGRDPALVRVNTMPDQHPHPLLWMLRDLEKYAVPIEHRDMDRRNFKRDMDDPEQRAEYEMSKKVEKCYERVFLSIWAAGLEGLWKPREPAWLSKEFDQATGFSVLQTERLKNMGDDDDFREVLDRARMDYFGSIEAWEAAQIGFYDQKAVEFARESGQ